MFAGLFPLHTSKIFSAPQLKSDTMTKNILSLNLPKKKELTPEADNTAKKGARREPQSDPLKRFLDGVAVNPTQCIHLELGSSQPSMRAMDLITPIGMGQRGLIVAPPGCGKTTILKHICQAVGCAYPAIKLYALLIDERPEEVTDFTRSVPAQVHASSTDESYEHHVRVANKLIQKAQREAGEGHDVMIVIDSLTRLTRVHNARTKNSGRTMSGGLDAKAMEIPRKLFGAARKIENGGSLTILATILADTGSRMDQIIFEEFKGTGNMEIVLSRDIADKRIFPALDIAKSSTRREELLISAKDIENVRTLRRGLTGLKAYDGAAKLFELLEKYPTNAQLLEVMSGKKM
jgi:transcription termination factor Rho